MHALGIDRRILRAFYTQYIAVLLIVLVFFVAAFQRSGAPQPVMASSMVQSLKAELPFTTPITLRPFRRGAEIEATNPQLLAITKLLRIHDVEATFVFGVSTSPAEIQSSDLVALSTRVDALERFFEEQEVPQGATRYVIEHSDALHNESIVLLLRAQGGKHE
jgi:hypothetical protein